MQTITSRDGTPVAFEQSGQGPALILVAGALTTRTAQAPLAAQLERDFTVFTYDRRGRGESGDAVDYAVEHEVEDIAALIAVAGGSAFLFGHSSGGALLLEAALQVGEGARKLAIYEVPYNDDREARRAWREYRQQLDLLIAAGKRGDALALFMQLVGMPVGQIEAMRQTPTWAALEAIAPTLAYDAACVGADGSVPVERVAGLTVPALLLSGNAGLHFMQETALTLSKALPRGQLCILEGQNHAPDPVVLASVLKEFFLA